MNSNLHPMLAGPFETDFLLESGTNRLPSVVKCIFLALLPLYVLRIPGPEIKLD